MSDTAGFPRRIIQLILLVLIWTMAINSVSAFATADQLEGILEALVAVALLGVLVDGRVVDLLAGRPIARTVIPILILIEFVILYGALPGLFDLEISTGNDLYIPGVLALAHSVGSIFLALLLGWETIKLATRRTA